MFSSTYNKGYQITFANGLTISVQFGVGNYCDNRNKSRAEEMKNTINQSTTAEIAIWDSFGNWYDFGNDTVKGFVSPEEVAEWTYKTSKAENIFSI